MKKLFFYKRKTYVPKKDEEGKETSEREVVWMEDSFNPDYVIRSMGFTNGIAVLLDDGHEMSEEEPVRNKKSGAIEYQRKRAYHQSEIHLEDPNDIERFKLLSIY
jgi:hypothetical protein